MNFKEMTQTELAEHAFLFDDVGAIKGELSDYQWDFSYIKVQHLMRNEESSIPQSEWISWVEEERTMRRAEFGYDSIKEIAEHWLKDTEKEPLILILKENSCYQFADGFHRFGIAVKNGLQIVPAIIGTKK